MHCSTTPFTANGRLYHPPARPVAVLCIDGCADEYLSVSISAGMMPNTLAMVQRGYRGMVRGALPSFTNVNNSAIVTGMPPSVTGICGNFFLDPETGLEVMMNGPEFLRCGTLLTAAADAGRRVAFITAKEKLRTLLGDGIVERGGIAFSSEKVDEARLATHGVDQAESIIGKPRPEIYSGDASVYVLEAGAALVEQERADFLYLSLTDYMQHKFAPGGPREPRVSRPIGPADRPPARGRVRCRCHCRPWDEREEQLRWVAERDLRRVTPARAIWRWYPGDLSDHRSVRGPPWRARVAGHGPPRRPGQDRGGRSFPPPSPRASPKCITRELAALKLELAADRIGDLTVLCGRDLVLGKTPAHHDLSVLGGGLRSHGGRYEEMVPMLLSEPLNQDYLRKARGDPRNFDIFDFACNASR